MQIWAVFDFYGPLNALNCDFDTLILEIVPTVGGGPPSNTLPRSVASLPRMGHRSPITPPPQSWKQIDTYGRYGHVSWLL